MTELFDMDLRARRRDRAARSGVELVLAERTFADCLERIELTDRRFDHALLIGCPDGGWRDRVRGIVPDVDVRDPGPLLAQASGGTVITEDRWEPPAAAYDLVLAIGTLDTVNDLPLALRLLRRAMRSNALLIGAVAGGETLPRLRGAMLQADALGAGAAPHVHPRIEASALAPLLESAGFLRPVVDVDRISLTYASFAGLVKDLRAMAATNILISRPGSLTRAQTAAAAAAFEQPLGASRFSETIEILHFAAWTQQD